MFKNINFECMIYLLSILESRIYLPEEYIVYENTYGNEMYFIQSGLLEVIDESKNVRIRLIEGDFFGEQALLNNAQRNASVKSVIYSELLILTREGLKKLINAHPLFAVKLFSYLKNKIMNQLKNGEGRALSRIRWNFLSLIIKTAQRICKLSEKTISLENLINKNNLIFENRTVIYFLNY